MTGHAVSVSLSGAPARFEAGLVPVAGDVWAWLQPNGGTGEANAGLVAGRGEAAVVDTCWDARQARRLLEACAPHVAASPISVVVNTHSNGDHWWGNALMPEDADIVTSDAALAAMGREKPHEMEVIRHLVALGRHLPRGLGRSCAYFHAQLAPFEFGGVKLRRPTTTFSGRRRLDVGGRAVELVEVGPAHTAGDLVVHVPDAAVVFAGDLLFVGQTPAMWEGPASAWLSALGEVARMDARVVVPGHGPLAGRRDLTAMRDYWEWFAGMAGHCHTRGLPVLAASLEIVTAAKASRYPWAEWDAPERTFINVTTEFSALDDARPATSPLATLSVLTGMARMQLRLGGMEG